MKEFNEYIETNKWLKKLMDDLSEEDGMRLEDSFYAFKNHYTKAENLPISDVRISLPSDAEIHSMADEASLRQNTRDRMIHAMGLEQGAIMTLKEITETLKESHKVYGKMCNTEIIGDEIVQVNKATGTHHPFINGMFQIKLQPGQKEHVKKSINALH